MSKAGAVAEWVGLLGRLGQVIVDAVESGERDEEILQRIADPSGVGAELIAAVRRRRDKFRDYIDKG